MVAVACRRGPLRVRLTAAVDLDKLYVEPVTGVDVYVDLRLTTATRKMSDSAPRMQKCCSDMQCYFEHAIRVTATVARPTVSTDKRFVEDYRLL